MTILWRWQSTESNVGPSGGPTTSFLSGAKVVLVTVVAALHVNVMRLALAVILEACLRDKRWVGMGSEAMWRTHLHWHCLADVPGVQALGTVGYRLQVKWAVGKSKEREVADRVMTEVENCHAK